MVGSRNGFLPKSHEIFFAILPLQNQELFLGDAEKSEFFLAALLREVNTCVYLHPQNKNGPFV